MMVVKIRVGEICIFKDSLKAASRVCEDFNVREVVEFHKGNINGHQLSSHYSVGFFDA